MNNIYIYLAGPISGETEQGATEWRDVISEHLTKVSDGLVGISPLRCEAPKEDGTYPVEVPYKMAHEVTAKNMLDVRRCDLMLAYLPKVSIGTLQEIGWAVGMGKTVIVVSDINEVLQHPIIMATVPFLFDSRESGWSHAMQTIKGLFEVYV